MTATDRNQGDYWYWLAPQKYLGNQAAAYGGLLQFELKQSETLQQDRTQPDLILIGGGLTLFYSTTNNPGTNWTIYKVLLDETGGSIARAAMIFGVHRSTIYRWLRGH